MRRLLPLFFLVACAHQYTVAVTETAPQNAHYVLLRDKDRVYDCMSMPDGKTWHPTCVRVEILPKAFDLVREAQPDLVSWIRPDEASMTSMDLASRGGSNELTSGPAITVRAPSGTSPLAGAVPIDIDIGPGTNGLAPNFDTLKVTYLRGWGIDITDRVRPYVQDGKINNPGAPIPPGTHSLEFYIEDAEQNASSKVITVTVQ